ncbi:Bifunctional purple acid phosphatase 26, partial [Sesamum angolense]
MAIALTTGRAPSPRGEGATEGVAAPSPTTATAAPPIDVSLVVVSASALSKLKHAIRVRRKIMCLVDQADLLVCEEGKDSMLVQLLLLSSILLTCVSNGNAGVTSSFIRNEWPSIDIPLDNEVFAVPKGYNAPQQVHITQGDYDGRAVIISWVTANEPGSNRVRVGLSEGKYDIVAEGTVHNYTFYNYKSGYIHQCLVDDLQYDTKYYYEIGDGDLGQTFNSLSTLEHSMQTGAQTILFVGDLSYADRYDNHDVGVRWDSWVVLLNAVQHISHGSGLLEIMKLSTFHI